MADSHPLSAQGKALRARSAEHGTELTPAQVADALLQTIAGSLEHLANDAVGEELARPADLARLARHAGILTQLAEVAVEPSDRDLYSEEAAALRRVLALNTEQLIAASGESMRDAENPAPAEPATSPSEGPAAGDADGFTAHFCRACGCEFEITLINGREAPAAHCPFCGAGL